MSKFILPFGGWFLLTVCTAAAGVIECFAWHVTLGSHATSTGECTDVKFVKVTDAQVGLELTVDGEKHVTTDINVLMSYLENVDLGTVPFEVRVSGDIVARPRPKN